MRRSDLGRRQRRVDPEAREQLALLFLDGADHRDEQVLLRAEVVDEHAVARADRGREAAQAQVGDAVLGDVVDRRAQQPFLRVVLGAGHLISSATLCTMWYMYQMVHDRVGTRRSPCDDATSE